MCVGTCLLVLSPSPQNVCMLQTLNINYDTGHGPWQQNTKCAIFYLHDSGGSFIGGAEPCYSIS